MDQSPSKLPIVSALDSLARTWAKQQRWVVEAAPGAGKSTELPKFIVESLMDKHQRLVLVQPRRSATKAVAQRIADLLDEPLGQRVGYQIAKDQKLSAKTQIVVMTSGVLLQHFASDSTLETYDVIVLDEFHERSWQLDALYSLALQLTWLRDELKLLVLSATLPGEKIAEHMQGKLIKVSGRQFPVDLSYVNTDDVVSQSLKIIQDNPEPTLVFLPGRRWIEQLAQQINGRPVYLLHSGVELSEQQRAIEAQESNRVVIATNIAETSLTLSGITLVIDSGLAREPVINVTSGLTRLVTRRITQASADQRAGRAGRTQPGRAVRLWPRDEPLVANARPEIEYQSVFELYLRLMQIGEQPSDLPWLASVNPLSWQKAEQQAKDWGWQTSGSLSPTGLKAIALSTEPNLARLILCQPNNGQAVTLAAHIHCHGESLSGEIGLSQEVAKQLQQWRKAGFESEPIKKGLGDLLAPGFSQLLVAPNQSKTLAGQHVDCTASHWQLVWQANVQATQLKVRQAFRVSDDVAKTVLTANERQITSFEWAQNKPKKRLQTKVHNTIIKQSTVTIGDGEWLDAICQRLESKGIAALMLTKTQAQWWQKASFAKGNLLDTLFSDIDWIKDYLTGINHFDQARIWQAIVYQIDPDGQINQSYPSDWVSPAGTKHAIDYAHRATVSVKLQACFGLQQQPMIAGEPLQINLCSPSGQPVAQTTDIQFFWQDVYPQVRKELRGRYNKHPWPEDPQNAQATMQTNRQLRQQ